MCALIPSPLKATSATPCRQTGHSGQGWSWGLAWRWAPQHPRTHPLSTSHIPLLLPGVLMWWGRAWQHIAPPGPPPAEEEQEAASVKKRGRGYKNKTNKILIFSRKQHHLTSFPLLTIFNNMNALKPDFVSNYYKTSTFSFLSTNKAKLQQKVAERARSNINPAANSRDDGDDSMDSQRREGEDEEEKGQSFHTVDTGPKVILHIDMVFTALSSPSLFPPSSLISSHPSSLFSYIFHILIHLYVTSLFLSFSLSLLSSRIVSMLVSPHEINLICGESLLLCHLQVAKVC